MGLKKSSRPVGQRRFPMAQLGYGNITPVSKVARMLAAMEAMTGLLYIAVVIARLIGLYSSKIRMIPRRAVVIHTGRATKFFAVSDSISLATV